ncbi:hypothetical protein LAX46_23015, partial [Escherichia coli]|nr:hypothetical protein [Escherichia coli]MDD8701809.1 hypothetical protein [Escherichia coli]
SHCSLIQAFYANTVIIFLKPEGLFRLSSPPALGEGSRRFFAECICPWQDNVDRHMTVFFYPSDSLWSQKTF